MANTYYDSELTAAEIESALEAINDVIKPANNGKILAIENGKFVAKSASEWTDAPVLVPLNATHNGDYLPDTNTDGYNSVHVAVPQSATLIEKTITDNGTYNASSDNADGYSKVVVDVSGGGGGGDCSIVKSSTEQLLSVVDASYRQNFIRGGSSSYKNLSSVENNYYVADCENLMAQGWGYGEYYTSENQIGVYRGLEYSIPMDIDKARFYIGKYEQQNLNLTVTFEYKDANDNWIEISDATIGPSTSYPINYFDITMPSNTNIYGVRWIHKKGNNKSNANNIVFFGIVLFKNNIVAGESSYINSPSSYIQFDGTAPLTLPLFGNADYEITCVFDAPQYVSNMAIIGEKNSNIRPVSLCMYSNKFYTGNGNGEVTFTPPSFTGKHIIVLAHNNRDYYDSVKVLGNITPVTDPGSSSNLLVGGRYSATNYVGKIHYYLIKSISTGNKVMELVPFKVVRNSDNRTLLQGFYDTVGDVFYQTLGGVYGT